MLPITRMMLLLVLAMAMLRMPLCAAEDKTPPAEKLIEQLGSDDFALRERAARILQARGPAVLPALRNARNHRDAEVRRRVREMIPLLETAAALEPKRVTLGSEPRTLSAILKEIEKQTGYKVKAEDAGAGEYSFEMKEVPFWEAVERIERQTGRFVSDAADGYELRLNPSKARSPFVALNGPFRLEVLRLHEDRDIDFTEPGKGKEQGSRDYSLKLTISVLAEPRFILATGQARVQIATDEDGKSLESLAPDDPPKYFYMRPELGWKNFAQSSEVFLQRSSGKARTIKVLRGTIPVQVVVERKRVVFTENVLKAKGVKCRVRQGTLEIAKAVRDDNGDLDIRIVVPVDEEGGRLRWLDRVHLEDAKGNPYKAFSRGTESLGGAPTEIITLTYLAAKNPKVGPPSKLIVEDWTILDYEIPFEFKNVPLP